MLSQSQVNGEQGNVQAQADVFSQHGHIVSSHGHIGPNICEGNFGESQVVDDQSGFPANTDEHDGSGASPSDHSLPMHEVDDHSASLHGVADNSSPAVQTGDFDIFSFSSPGVSSAMCPVHNTPCSINSSEWAKSTAGVMIPSINSTRFWCYSSCASGAVSFKNIC
ncbi:hypothetical protein V6N11_059500 [Hibiscus sabdariffa]|uniref:Uncharacterized protein n=2 Tax=Hibiscus sabdariffa TaxID=183260 RepID=A0ABR2F3N3_9ROSI